MELEPDVFGSNLGEEAASELLQLWPCAACLVLKLVVSGEVRRPINRDNAKANIPIASFLHVFTIASCQISPYWKPVFVQNPGFWGSQNGRKPTKPRSSWTRAVARGNLVAGPHGRQKHRDQPGGQWEVPFSAWQKSLSIVDSTG